MTTLEITLIIIGVVFLIGSFMVNDKLSHKDLDKIADMSAEELKIITEKEVTAAKKDLSDALGPWKNANKNMVAATEQLGAQYWFGNVIPRSNLTSAVFAAAVMAFLVWYVMERTSVGYEMRITGENPRFAFFSGLRTDQIVLLSMVVSGAMCGLVGMFRVYGVEHLYRDSVSKDYYFEALMVAMIAQYKPVTVILLSLFFAVLKIGAQGMELIGIPSQIYLIIQTVIIFCMAAESGITRSLTAAHERRRAKRAAEERLKEELKHG